MTGTRRMALLAAVLLVVAVAAACSTSPKLSVPDLRGDNPDSIVDESVLLLPGEPTAPVQLVALTSHYDRGLSSTVYELVRLDGVSDKPVWRTPPLGDDTYRVPLASDGSRVLTAIDDKVYAFDLGNGQPMWEAKLSDVYEPSCDNCFDVVDGMLVVRSYDAEIHGIDTKDGTMVWSHRLVDTSGGSRVVGSHLLLFDGAGDASTTSVIDPTTGDVLVELDAGCTDREDASWARSPTDDTILLASTSDPAAAYLGYGLIPACWQKWDLDAGTQIWDTVLPDDYLDHRVVTVLDEPVLTFSTRNPSLAQLDTDSGAGAAIPIPPEMEITPIARVDNQVITRSVSTRGTPKWSIVSIDATSGAVLWSTSLEGATPSDEFGASTVSSGETDFIEHVDGDQLRLVLLDGDGNLFTQIISLTDGSTAGRTPVAFQIDDMSFPSFSPISWRGPNAIIVAFDRLLVVDTTTSTVSWSY